MSHLDINYNILANAVYTAIVLVHSYSVWFEILIMIKGLNAKNQKEMLKFQTRYKQKMHENVKRKREFGQEFV